MARFLAILVVSAVILSFLLFVLLISPLPKSICELLVVKSWPETGYFKIAELKLIPSKPFEASRIEYQIKRDPNLGILRSENLKLSFDLKELFFGVNAMLTIKGLELDSGVLSASNIQVKLPLTLRPERSRLAERKGIVSIDQIVSNTARIRNVEFLFTEKRGHYAGTFRADWIGGVIQGRFDWSLKNAQNVKIDANLINLDLAILAQEAGGAFEQATGICQGNIEANWERKGSFKGRAVLKCPKPGGKLKAAFLRDMTTWMPQSPARTILEEEVAGKDNYYYDSAVFEFNNDTPGYWTIRTELNNPRLRLDLPVDISDQSLFVLWKNTELQKILKKWSESK